MGEGATYENLGKKREISSLLWKAEGTGALGEGQILLGDSNIFCALSRLVHYSHPQNPTCKNTHAPHYPRFRAIKTR